VFFGEWQPRRARTPTHTDAMPLARPPPPPPARPATARRALPIHQLAESVPPLVHFEPRLNPGVAVAAACAAVPPIVFWARIALNARRKVMEEEAKEAERAARLARLRGDE